MTPCLAFSSSWWQKDHIWRRVMTIWRICNNVVWPQCQTASEWGGNLNRGQAYPPISRLHSRPDFLPSAAPTAPHHPPSTLPLFCMKNHPRIPIEVSLQYFFWNKPKVAVECRNSFLLGWSLYNSDEKMTGCFWLTDPELLVYESYSFLGNMRWSNLSERLLFCIRYGYIYAQQVVCPGFM